ncbi:MAG TPA: TIGR01777 family oxidoreductase [Candidatus Limnocylindria bacterium]|nr:TIGR01777 family oxidoreductase [Candidatus Limnocylindria bacterium]
MRVVVTGATGFVGRAVVRELLGAGHSVTALSRDAERAARELPARCRTLVWDAESAVDPHVLRGAHAVVHLAGAGVFDARWTAARKRTLRDSRIRTATALVNAIGQLPPADRPGVLVSASAIGWYGDRGDSVLDEDSAPGNGFLADLCRDWETAVFAVREHGARAVAVRIGVVLGRDGGALRPLLPLFRLGLGGRIGSGRQWFSWIHLRDLVGLLRFAIENSDVSGVMNGVAPEPVTNATFAWELGRAVHRPALVPVPALLLRMALGEMSAVLLDSQRVLPRRAERLGFTFRHSTLRDALDELCADPDHEISVEQRLTRPREEVFSFFSDPWNLEKITPDFLRFRILGMTTREVTEGTLIDYALRLHGIPLRWQSRIESWVPNRQFVDVQTRGPYASWHHTHEFESDDGGTIIRDRVRYRLPLGALGELAAAWLVNRDLKAVFDFRRRRIEELMG